MAIKNKSDLTTTNNLNITDPLNKQNTAARVRGINGDIIDSSLNLLDAAINSNNLGSSSGNNNGTRSTLISSDNSTISSGQSAIIAAKSSTVSADGSVVIAGYNSTSSGQHNLVTGYSNTSSGSQSIVGGNTNNSGGAQSLIVGNNNNNAGTGNIVAGQNNIVAGNNSFAIGKGVNTQQNNYQVVSSGYYGNLAYSGHTTMNTKLAVDPSSTAILTYNFDNSPGDMYKLRPSQAIHLRAFGMINNVATGNIASFQGNVVLKNNGSVTNIGTMSFPQLAFESGMNNTSLSFTYSADWWSISVTNNSGAPVTACVSIEYLVTGITS